MYGNTGNSLIIKLFMNYTDYKEFLIINIIILINLFLLFDIIISINQLIEYIVIHNNINNKIDNKILKTTLYTNISLNKSNLINMVKEKEFYDMFLSTDKISPIKISEWITNCKK